jgi:hypothetical protein
MRAATFGGIVSPSDSRPVLPFTPATIPAHPLDPIPHIIPHGSICTFSGPPHVGKTTMLAQWCARWREGLDICGHPTNCPPKIAILAADRRWQSAQQTFTAAGCGDIAHLSLRDEAATNWKAFRFWQKLPEIFHEYIKRLELPPGSLLIAEPLSLWLAGNLIDYKSVAIGLGELDQVIRRHQITLIGVFHHAKERGSAEDQYVHAHERILGSGAQIGFSDTTIYMLGPKSLGNGKKPADHYLLGWLSHNAPEETFKFTRQENGLFAPYVGLDGAGEDHFPDELPPESGEADVEPRLTPGMPSLTDWLISQIPETPPPMPVAALMEHGSAVYHVSLRSVRRQLEELRIKGFIIRRGRGYIRAKGHGVS